MTSRHSFTMELLDPTRREDFIDAYISRVGGNNELPYLNWTSAYHSSIYVSEGEFDEIKPPEG